MNWLCCGHLIRVTRYRCGHLMSPDVLNGHWSPVCVCSLLSPASTDLNRWFHRELQLFNCLHKIHNCWWSQSVIEIKWGYMYIFWFELSSRWYIWQDIFKKCICFVSIFGFWSVVRLQIKNWIQRFKDSTVKVKRPPRGFKIILENPQAHSLVVSMMREFQEFSLFQ